MRTYTQLTREERYQIYVLKQAGHQQNEIAKMLDRHKSTISRELRRNRGLRGYRPKQACLSRPRGRQAHRLALARRKAKVRPCFGSPIWRQIKVLIRQDWSPEQISGCLSRHHASKLVTSGFTSTSWRTNMREVTCIVIYAAKRNGVNAPAATNVAASCRTE